MGEAPRLGEPLRAGEPARTGEFPRGGFIGVDAVERAWRGDGFWRGRAASVCEALTRAAFEMRDSKALPPASSVEREGDTLFMIGAVRGRVPPPCSIPATVRCTLPGLGRLCGALAPPVQATSSDAIEDAPDE